MVLNIKRPNALLRSLSACVALAIISGCTNPLVGAAKAIQAVTIAPGFTLCDADGLSIITNSTLSFPDTSRNGTVYIELNLTNTGKSDLAIDIANTEIKMGAGTESGTFSFKKALVSTIHAGEVALFTLGFSPTAVGAKSATIKILSNAAANSIFVFTISGQGVSTAKEITSFSFKGLASDVVISENDITIMVPVGTDVRNLTAIFTNTGTSIAVQAIPQTSGLSVGNYYDPVVYTVTAADGTEKIYTVTVKVGVIFPVLNPTTVTAISAISATGNGNIVSDGGADITARGLCWSTSANPTIDDSTNTDGATNTGSFSYPLINLSPGTLYYTRAYASNSKGTGYGTQAEFITAPDKPAISSTDVANHQITHSWPGISSATSYNLYWSTTPDPTITTATKIENVSSPYVHSGLPNNKNYYYILTAINPAGESSPSSIVTAMPMQSVVYINSYNRVNIYSVDNTTGALGALISGQYFYPGQISSIAVDKARKYAYLVDRGYSKVYSYEINSTTGALSDAGGPVSTGASSFPSYIVIDSGSGYVYVVNSGPKNIIGYSVNSLDGSLTALTDPVFPMALANEQINGVSISPGRPFIYFSTYDFTLEKGHIYSNSINTGTGKLSPVGSPTETPCFPGPMAFDLTGEYLYVTNHSAKVDSVDLYSYRVSSFSGELSTRVSNSINNVSVRNISNSDLAIDPLGRFLFVGDRFNDNSLTVFKINNGLLSKVLVDGKDSLPILYEPGCMAVDTNGYCLYVVNGSKIESYSINQTTGALTFLSTTETKVAGDHDEYYGGEVLVRDITVVSLP